MKKEKYQRYRITQWVDTSDENAESYPILFGIQIQPESRGKWSHCHRNGEPILHNDMQSAEADLAAIKACA